MKIVHKIELGEHFCYKKHHRTRQKVDRIAPAEIQSIGVVNWLYLLAIEAN